MMCLKLFIVLYLFSSAIQSSLISHDYKTVKTSSKNSNIVSLDLIDESTFDIHYQTKCEECKCFVDLAPLTNKLTSEKKFQAKVLDSFMGSDDKLHLLHKLDSDNTFSYSIYKISSSGFQEIVKEAPLINFKGSQDVKFSSSYPGFFTYDSNSVMIYFFDGGNKVKYQDYKIQRNENTKIYDVALISDTLFLAQGPSGLEAVSIRDSKKTQHFSIQDLELKEGSSITKLSVNPAYGLLYAWSENAADHSFFLALNVKKPDDISILNNYQKEIYNIVKLIPTQAEIHVINNIGEKYYYTQFSLSENDKFANIQLNKVWEVPFKVNGMNINGDKLLIEGDDYLYIFKNNLPYETQAPELLLEIVKKTISDPAGVSYPVIEKEETSFVTVGSLGLESFVVNKNRDQPSLNCGSFSPNYQGEFTFNIFVYKNSCPELGKNNKNDICLYRYTYDITFSGTKYEPIKQSSYVPTYIENSVWDSSIPLIAIEEAKKIFENSHKHSENKTSTTQKEDQNKGGIPLKPTKTDPSVDPTPHYNNNFDIRMKYVFIVSGLIIIAIFACLLKCFCGESKEQDEFEDDEHPHIQHQKLDETDQYDNSDIQNDEEEEEEAEEGEEEEEEEEEEKQNNSDLEAHNDNAYEDD